MCGVRGEARFSRPGVSVPCLCHLVHVYHRQLLQVITTGMSVIRDTHTIERPQAPSVGAAHDHKFGLDRRRGFCR